MLDVALQVLAKAGRSLSARKILELGEQEGLFDPVPSATALREALGAAAAEGGLREVRRGVFDRPEPAAEPAPPPEPPARAAREAREERDDDGDDRRRRRRRPKAKELLGDEPVAALSVEDAVAEAESSADTSSLRRKLWDKMRDGAAAAVGDTLPEVEAPAPAPAGGDRLSRLKARMKAAATAEARDRPEPAAPVVLALLTPAARVVSGDPEADLQARLKSRRALNPARPIGPPTPEPAAKPAAPKAAPPQPAAPQPAAPRAEAAPKPAAPTPAAPKAAPPPPAASKVEAAPAAAPEAAEEPRAPRRTRTPRREREAERREARAESVAAEAPAVEAPPAAPQPAAPKAEAPKVEAPRAEAPRAEAPKAEATVSLARRIRDVLADEDRPSGARRLAERLGEEPAAIRAAVVGENARRVADGLRPVFLTHHDGTLGLTEWGLSDRYLELEDIIQDALVEQQSLARRAVVERIADLSDGGFEQIISLLLERMGHEAVRVVHRGAGVVAMLTRRDDETVAVVARRGRAVVGADTVEALEGNLPRFDAALGILLTVGRFDDKARAAARKGGVRLVDGQGLGRLLYTHGVGFARHQPIVRYVDAALFASLG